MKRQLIMRMTALLLSVVLMCSVWSTALSAAAAENYENSFVFSEEGITASDTASGYKATASAGTQSGSTLITLTINSAGTYYITGSCSNGTIAVKKGVTDVVLILDSLTLRCEDSAPLVIKKDGASVTVRVMNTVTLTDAENPDNEEAADEAVADAFEGAAIKVKSASSLLLEGDGVLNIDASACKNGIKGAATAAITVGDALTLNIDALNNGLASDGSVTVNGGTLNITAGNDGIKSEPDEDDADSLGIVTITDGLITINAGGDGIHAANTVNISGGSYNIVTFGGAAKAASLGDNSAKGIKASSGTSEDTSEVADTVNISGGTFVLNTADDAVHSNAYIYITGGSFIIQTGDDGMHADTLLSLGEDGGSNTALSVDIQSCYEGLEAGTVNIYSGNYTIVASDDGINAADGSTSGTDNQPAAAGGTGHQTFPGGNAAAGPGGDRFNPFGGAFSQPGGITQSTESAYSINIYGGVIYVNAEGDGLDSNGALNLLGGYLTVWGMQAGGDNEPLDYETSLKVCGATVFAAGSRGMGGVSPSADSQGYITSATEIAAQKTIDVTANGSTVFSITAPKRVNYVFFSSPSTGSSWKITTGSAATGNMDLTQVEGLTAAATGSANQATVSSAAATEAAAQQSGSVSQTAAMTSAVTVKTRIKKLLSKANGFTVKWKKIASADGYQIQYSTAKSFKTKKTVTANSVSQTKKTVTGLKAKKTYYVRVRTYKVVNGKRVYSQWSKIKKVKTK